MSRQQDADPRFPKAPWTDRPFADWNKSRTNFGPTDQVIFDFFFRYRAHPNDANEVARDGSARGFWNALTLMLAWLNQLIGGSFLPAQEELVRIIAAVVLGGAVGLERELRDKPAGFRTIILICLGACVFTIVSQTIGAADGERTRIAAQIVSGIGFLGAGAILHDKANVLGLTTAATIWAVAAIGMAIGFGEIALAVAGTVAILVALFVFDHVEHAIGNHRDIQEYVVATANTDDVFGRMAALFDSHGLAIRKRSCYEETGSIVLHVIAMGAKTNHDRLRLLLARSTEYTLRRA